MGGFRPSAVTALSKRAWLAGRKPRGGGKSTATAGVDRGAKPWHITQSPQAAQGAWGEGGPLKLSAVWVVVWLAKAVGSTVLEVWPWQS